MPSDDYRRSHADAAQADWYEQGVYRSDSYDSWIWEREKQLLTDIVTRTFAGRPFRLLDFACGSGRIISFLEPLAAEAVGVDISGEMLKLARTKVRAATLVEGDMTADATILAGEKYDLITAFRFFLNAQDDLRHAALERLVPALADPGRLVFSIHGNAWSLRGPVYSVRRHILGQHINQLSYRRVERMLRQHGLEVKECHGIGMLTPRLFRALGAARADRIERLGRRVGLGRFTIELLFVAGRPAHAAGG